MDIADQLTILGRSALAAVLGIIIGLERETRGKAAGERTFALLSLGAAAFVAIGGFLFPPPAGRILEGIPAGHRGGGDPARPGPPGASLPVAPPRPGARPPAIPARGANTPGITPAVSR